MSAGRTCSVGRAVLCGLLPLVPAGVAAQVDYDVGLGVLGSVPTQFESDPCGPLFGVEVRGGLGVELPWHLVAESGVSVAGSTGGMCEAADLWIPPLNGTTRHLVFSEHAEEEPYVTLSQRLVLDVKTFESTAPRVFLGGGRFLRKGAWFWSAGLGLRFGPAGSAKVIEVERMHFKLGFIEEFRIREEGVVVDRYDTGPMKLDESMWAVRFRLPLGG